MKQIRTVMSPVVGAWVRDSQDRRGVVERADEARGAHVLVRWLDGQQTWIDSRLLGSGFPLGIAVQDVPTSATRRSLGEGVILDSRTLGARDQVLVEFGESGDRLWLPFQNLRGIKDCRQRMILGDFGDEGAAERFRLRCLAHALRSWNENTGSLSNLDIDPLPHQIFLVHHILASGSLNWLIADDVGLGKTIEVGMLLSALIQRRQAKRILIVCPAGIVRQWQEELHNKFALSEFDVYGEDFSIHAPRQWRAHDHVIGSIDRLKTPDHLPVLLQAGSWDLVVFDEAHRLSRRSWGTKYEAAQRFKLAAELRTRTDSMVLLSGTPHQGMPDKFQALLELLRPELKEAIEEIELHPEVLRRMVVRNHKADVTDADGNFVFRARVTHAVRIPISEATRRFEAALRRYLRSGYQAGSRMGFTGKAIGFVMTTYRKLAASSIFALRESLERRRQRLLGEADLRSSTFFDSSDERYFGELEELNLDKSADQATPFFAGELELVDQLIASASTLLQTDEKLAAFMDGIVAPVMNRSEDERLLVFTEYRATQRYLTDAIRARYGVDKVHLIHGGMTFQERAMAIDAFESDGVFLISTEAGGEGINLHRKCHIMANYDLPWNPMRLVQRVGRLYRYGQQKNVIVFNMHAPDTLDGQIVQHLYDRIDAVVQDMAAVSEEYNEGLRDEILGGLAELIDLEQILAEAEAVGITRTQERVDEALARAKQALEAQQRLFEHVSGFDPTEMRGELSVQTEHVRAFVLGMFVELGVEVLSETRDGRIAEVRLTDSVAQEIGSARRRLSIGFDRSARRTRGQVEVMDLGSPLFRFLLDQALRYEFGGHSASTVGLPYEAVLASVLRWQNEQGVRMRREFAVFCIDHNGQVSTNPEPFARWLLESATYGVPISTEREKCEQHLDRYKEAADRRLAAVSNEELHPDSRHLVAVSWITPSGDDVPTIS